MRAFSITFALIAAMAGAGGIGANAASSGPTGIDPMAANPPISGRMHFASGNRPEPAQGHRVAASAYSNGLAKQRDKALRLAQLFPNVAAPESTSGNPSLPPLMWVGLLIVPSPTQRSPNNAVMCTAQFIKPNVLLTAAHCLKDLQTNPVGPWPDPTKGIFYLQYQNDSGRGPFHIVCAVTNPLWTYPPNYTSLTANQQEAAQVAAFQHDFAMIMVDASSPTGVMPYALDWKGKYTSVIRVGYPVDILDAAIVQEAGGDLFFSNAIPMGIDSQPNIVVQWGPVTEATQGMSGGAWIANFSVNEGPNSNILIAVSSFENPNFPGASFATYLTAAEFNPLLASVSNGCKK
jgi:hypothetical protein